ncbi:MAG: putative zinc-binding metallopeptidase [Bacteroidales bacterium]|nr:putative zinc-binding metallopeptidase [Bacteroidales bacterium]
MKKTIKTLSLAFIALATSFGAMSCSEELGETIFPDVDETLDPNSYTYALDSYIKHEYNEPYNISFLYKLHDVSSDMDYNLIPCSYDKSIDFAVLNKYLWFDIYAKLAGEKEVFLKKYSPRILHIIGSPAVNPSTGTIKLGEAEGGKKITLYRGNGMNTADIDQLNEFYFKTMHHEFGHILHQNHLYPNDYRLFNNGQYAPQDWQNTPDSVALGRGFITPYASNTVDDDVVELFANYIVKDDETWNQMMECSKFDWEKTESVPVDTFKNCIGNGVSRDLFGYVIDVVKDTQGNETSYTVQRKSISRDAVGRPILTDGTVVFFGIAPKDTIRNEEGEIQYTGKKDKDGNPIPQTKDRDDYGWTTRSVADSSYIDVTGKIVFNHASGKIGYDLLQQKLTMIKNWLKEYFELDLDELHKEVQRRQYLTATDEEGNEYFPRDVWGRPINRLSAPYTDESGKSYSQFIDYLRYQVLKYKENK